MQQVHAVRQRLIHGIILIVQTPKSARAGARLTDAVGEGCGAGRHGTVAVTRPLGQLTQAGFREEALPPADHLLR